MAHQEFGVRLLERVRKDLDAVGVVEQFPKLEGRQMVMVLAPKKKGPPAPKAKPKETKEVKAVKPAAPPKRQAA
jgi:translation initiation factor IF-3